MKINWLRVCSIGAMLIGSQFFQFIPVTAAAPVDSWIDDNNNTFGPFKWETGSEWSLGTPPSQSDSFIFMTNVVPSIGIAGRTVTIDGTTVLSNAINGCMTVQGLLVSSPTTKKTELFVNNTGSIALHALFDLVEFNSTLQISTNGILSIANSTVEVDIGRVTSLLDQDGAVLLNSGTLSGNMEINGSGTMTVFGGTVNGNFISVGGGPTPGDAGTLTMEGGTFLASFISVTTGTVWVTGGSVALSDDLFVGGAGNMIISNGAWQSLIGFVQGSGGAGTLTCAGGTGSVYSNLMVGSVDCSTIGALSVNGGALYVTNAAHNAVLDLEDGTLTVSAGTLTVDNLVATNACANFVYTGGTIIVNGQVETVTNSSIASANGKWETAANWSLGTAPAISQTIVMTNGFTMPSSTKTVTIDPTTVSAAPGSMNIGNLLVAGRGNLSGGIVNSLLLSNTASTPLSVLSNVTVSNRSNIIVTNSILSVGGAVEDKGDVELDSGSILTPNGAVSVGPASQWNMFGGTWLALNAVVGDGAGSQATLFIGGGSVTMLRAGTALDVGFAASSVGLAVMTGGQLNTTNGAVTIGNAGVGQMTVSNATWQGESVFVGLSGKGTLTIAGGTSTFSDGLDVGFNAAATGIVWMTGGQLTAGFGVDVGLSGVGQMTVSNGLWQGNLIQVGAFGGAGTLTVVGGTNSAYSELLVGAADCSSMGTVVIAGGNLLVTNAAGNAVLDVEDGTFTLNSGTVVVNEFVMTNACAHFVRTGGTLIYGTALLNPNADADGDGIPNGYEQSHGLDPLNAADANADNDGDGFSNLQEYLAGTDPNNSASYFHITSVVPTGNNVLVTWMMGAGKTNALQRTSGAVDGSYQTNTFTDIFIVTNTVVSITNYLDVGGATNSPAHFYRVRLVP